MLKGRQTASVLIDLISLSEFLSAAGSEDSQTSANLSFAPPMVFGKFISPSTDAHDQLGARERVMLMGNAARSSLERH